jgi:hypothetical protein
MSKRSLSAIVVALIIVGAFAILAVAQDRTGPLQRVPSQDDTGRPGRPGRVGPPIRFDMGDVVSVDAAAKTLVLGSLRGGVNQTIKVADDAVITRRVNSGIPDLKVGEMISVRGTPTELIAKSIESSETPEMLGQVSPFGGAGGRVFTRADGAATGKIVSTQPLTLEVDDQTRVVIKPDTTKLMEVSRTVKIGLADLKPGEFISIHGTGGDGEPITATSVAVTPERRPPGFAEGGGTPPVEK